MIIFKNIFDTCSILCLYPPQYPVSLYKWPPLPSNPVWGNICILSETWRNWKNQQTFWWRFKRKEYERAGNLRWAWKIENDSWSLSWIENLSLLIEETHFIFLVPDYLERWSVGSSGASSIPRWPGIICQHVQPALKETSWFVASWIG